MCLMVVVMIWLGRRAFVHMCLPHLWDFQSTGVIEFVVGMRIYNGRDDIADDTFYGLLVYVV